MSSNQYTEEQYHRQIKTLLEFIYRLGNSARGINREIDSKLAKIRSVGELGPAGLEQLRPLMSQVTQSLQREQAVLEHSVAETHKIAAEAVRAIIDITSLSCEQRERARSMLERVDAPLYSHSELLPLLTDLLSLHRETLRNAVFVSSDAQEGSHQGAGIADETNAEAAFIGEQQLVAWQSELSNVLATIDFKGQASAALHSLRQQLLQQMDAATLLTCCLGALKLVVRGVNEERQSAQQFLLSLNDALDSVGKALSKALQTHEQGADSQSALAQQLQRQVGSLSEAVNSSVSLQELKEQVHQHVSRISATLSSKLELEATERKQLHTELLSMQARLEDVESEARMYKRKLSEQKFKSLQDSLTRLPNRAAFEERLQLEYQRWQSYAAPLCIAIADIDNFKVINDTYGHTAGDKTLQVIANMLKKSLRETDFACRYGGEEFVIIFPQTSTETALELLEKARHRIKSIPFKFKQENISITISAGVSSFSANDSPTRVFERADRALYQAKDDGRDRVCHQ